MDWDTFVENVKTFWNQPLTIIIFVSFVCLIGFIVIFSKTSAGKKSLKSLRKLYEELKARYDIALEINKQTRQEFDDFKDEKEKQIVELTDAYQLKLDEYNEIVVKQNEIIKAICENSPNKHVKEAYEHYSLTIKNVPLNEAVEKIKEKVSRDYADRIKALEDFIYGKKAEETTNDQATSE